MRTRTLRDYDADIKVLGFVSMLLLILAAMSGCSNGPAGPTAVTPTPAVRTIGYDINVPIIEAVMVYKASFPDGINITPVEAQARYDYSDAYRGSPNVYFGATAPKCQQYIGTGIVVAPHHVATMLTFTSKDWPILEPGYTYTWVGRFVLALPATPQQYLYDPSCI